MATFSSPFELDPRLVSYFKAYSHVMAWVAVVVGCLAVLAWWLPSDVLRLVFRVRGMTGVILILAGIVMLLARRETTWGNRACLVLAVVLIGVGSLTMADRIGWLDLGLQRWTIAQGANLTSARSPLVVGLVAVLVGVRAILFCYVRGKWIGQVVAILLLASSMVAMAALGVSVARGPESIFSSASPLTAVVLFAYSLAWIALRPESRLCAVVVSSSVGGLMARRLLLPSLVLPLLYAWIFQWMDTRFELESAVLIALSALVTSGSVATLVWMAAVFAARIQQQKKKEQTLRNAASTDPLTQLPNRRAFDAQLSNALQKYQSEGLVFCLMIFDLDFFKSYNDTFGHAAGDEVLRRVAGVLQRSVRPHDLAARFGGEEFVVVLPNTRLDIASQVAERIRQAFLTESWPERAVTTSIGLAQVQSGDTAESLLKRADAALYQAKAEGRNRVVAET